MPTIRIPTPLRQYTENLSVVTVEGQTAGAALNHLAEKYPQLRQHLFEDGELRSFVNLFLNEEDIRYLDGAETAVGDDDTLMIIPSIAGGAAVSRPQHDSQVDQSALKVNQAFIISLLLAAFIFDSWAVAAFVAAVMLLGTAVPQFSLFKLIYARLLRPLAIVKPHLRPDNPQPHRFAQGLGGFFVALAVAALLTGNALVGWVLTWLVIVLAALNFFLGFCAGCFLYYQLSRLGLPGFTRKPLAS